MSWRDEAACAAADPALFFPSRVEKGPVLDALAYCRGCPVTAECLGEARVNNDVGVWGGVLRTAAWNKLGGGVELGPNDLDRLGRRTKRDAGAPAGSGCPRCGRSRLKRNKQGEIGRHLNYDTGTWCDEDDDEDAVA